MRTKIIATIGPSSANEEKLLALAKAGVNIFRLNFSHGNKDFFRSVISAIRNVQEKLGINLTVLQDLSGPKIRIGTLDVDSYQVQFGDVFYLGKEKVSDTYPFIPFEYEEVIKELKIGESLVLADGSLQFTVKECLGHGVLIESQSYGIITSRKGLAIPKRRFGGRMFSLPSSFHSKAYHQSLQSCCETGHCRNADASFHGPCQPSDTGGSDRRRQCGFRRR